MENTDISNFIEAIPEALLLVDKTGHVQFVNEGACQLFGYEKSELLGMVVEQLIPARYRHYHVQLRSQLGYEKKIRKLGEGKILYACHSDGRDLPVHISIGALHANCSTSFYVVTLVDRSEQLKVETEFRNSSSFYHNLFEKLPLPYQSLDIEGNLIAVNQTWLDFLGYEEDEVIGRFFGDFMTESSLQLLGVTFEKFKREGYVSSPIFETKRKGSDEPLIVTINGRVERDAAERFIRTHCVLTDVTQRIKAERELQQRAFFDGLTGVFNRDHFYQLANTQFASARRNGFPLTLLMLDVDHFKRINDSYGHAAGDTVLKTLAKSFPNTLREQDISGRVGGEEFAILLPKTNQKNGVQIAERLRLTLAQQLIPMENQATINITVSMGVAHLIDADTSFDSLMKRADKALYRAKHLGRNQTINFEKL